MWCAVMSPRRHLFTYKLTTKQNKDHNWNVKSNWKCYVCMFILQCSTFASALDSFTSRHCLIALLPFVRFILSTSLCLRIVFDICIHVSRYHCQMFPNGCTVVFHCIRHTSIFDSFRVPFLLSSHLSPFSRTSAWHFYHFVYMFDGLCSRIG